MNKPLVSLITTVRNGERYLPQAMASVLSQTIPNWEWIIWDDGSTDQTRSLIANAASRESRICFVCAKHKGRVPSLIDAMTMARGHYLGWLDCDDTLQPNTLELTARFLNDRPGVDLVHTAYSDMSADGNHFAVGKRNRVPYSPQALLTNFMVFHFRLFRWDALAKLGDLSDLTPFAEDYDFVLRLSEVGNIAHLPISLYNYRHHNQSTSHQHRLQQINASRTAIERALNRRGLSDHLRVRLELQPRFSLAIKKEIS